MTLLRRFLGSARPQPSSARTWPAPGRLGEDLLYRRQFLIGPHPVPALRDWKVLSIGPGLTLHAHPDLSVARTTHDGVELTLLGDAVDALHPERANTEVLQALAPKVTIGTGITGLTWDWGGRWILICDDGRSTTLMHDAAGLRQVFYTTEGDSGPWCASRPERIAEAAGIHPDPVAREQFLESGYVARDREYYWPVSSSPYAGIRRLLPNHFLDVRTQTAHRYWPAEPLPPVPFEKAVVEGGRLLKGLVDGASRRYPLTLPITAGVDSRCLLAASRDVASDLFCYTFDLPGAGPRHPDVVVPRRLLRSLGIPHHRVRCPRRMTGTFADIYRRNAAAAHERAGAIAQGLFAVHPQGFVCLTGHASEITRCFYWRAEAYPEAVTVDTLLDRTNMDGTPFVRRHLTEWLVAALEVERAFGVAVLDLLYWEQRVGSWAANVQAEWDIVHERFPAFSCRRLLVTLLGTDPRYRGSPGEILHVAIMRYLWPDVLNEPLNPAPPLHWKERVRPFLRAVHMEGLARRMKGVLFGPRRS